MASLKDFCPAATFSEAIFARKPAASASIHQTLRLRPA
jgi:hypothetical protein